jgi:hypothetical protein
MAASSAVSVKATDGRAVPATWTPAGTAAAAAPAPAVLLVADDAHARADWAPVATRLAAGGIGVLAIELRPVPGDPADGAGDVLGALAWLRKQAAVDAAHITIAAGGDASLTALAAAASDPKVAALALVSPPLKRGDFDGAMVLVTYGERPFLVAVGKGDKPAARAALVLDGNAQGPHKIHIARIAGRGGKLIAGDSEAFDAFVGWVREVSGIKEVPSPAPPDPRPKPTGCPDASKCG